MKIVRVFTHHENPVGAGEAFIEDGVVAVGWVYDPTILYASKDDIVRYRQKLHPRKAKNKIVSSVSHYCRFRDELEEGQIVIAYRGDNTIAAVGKITGPFQYNDKNSVGDHNGLIAYPNQYPVEWDDRYMNFNRLKLVPALRTWVAIPGTVYVKKGFEVNSIEEIFE